MIGFLLVGSAWGVSDFRTSPVVVGSAMPESCLEVSVDGDGDGVLSANENEDDRRSSLGSKRTSEVVSLGLLLV